jgi:hypothetical protein
MRTSLVGKRTSGEGEPHSQDANVTEADKAKLKCRTEDTYMHGHTYSG